MVLKRGIDLLYRVLINSISVIVFLYLFIVYVSFIRLINFNFIEKSTKIDIFISSILCFIYIVLCFCIAIGNYFIIRKIRFFVSIIILLIFINNGIIFMRDVTEIPGWSVIISPDFLIYFSVVVCLLENLRADKSVF